MWFAHFYLINYDLVSSEAERLRRFLLTRPTAIVLDESQRIKNADSKATAAIHYIAPFAKKRFIITGTPIANSPSDIWAQVFFLDGGVNLGSDIHEFYQRFHVQARPHKETYIDETGLAALRQALSSFSMRRIKENVLELPEKTFKTVEVTLEKRQREMYDELRERLYLEIINQDGQQVTDNAENILKRMLRLVEISSNPGLFDTSYSELPAKFAVLDNLIKDIITAGEKAIIWTGFVKNIRLLRRRYDRYGAAMLFGDIPLDERARIVGNFQNYPELRVLVANPAAAKEGLTLTAANHAIYLDRNFNLLDYLQSQDRIHRISQEKTAYIYNVVGEKTIDAYIDDVVYRKQVIAKFVYGDTKELEMPPVIYSKEDILHLLGA
jgi:SNF2 family DNA or RNA helicase